jgi:tyrosine-protein phosphatase SIW14
MPSATISLDLRVLLTGFLALLTAGTLSGGVAAAEPAAAGVVADAPIKRFMQVAPGLYRGGQPDAEGFRYLRDLGIRTVVSLRNDDSERETVESLGMRFVHIPVTFRPLGGAMPRESVGQFLDVVDEPAHGPVFVHCKRGADRTGAFVGLYRMVRQGWGPDRAYDEARDIGMRWWYFAVRGQLAALAHPFRPARAVLAQ